MRKTITTFEGNQIWQSRDSTIVNIGRRHGEYDWLRRYANIITLACGWSAVDEVKIA